MGQEGARFMEWLKRSLLGVGVLLATLATGLVVVRLAEAGAAHPPPNGSPR